MSENTFTTLARFTYSSEAKIFKGRLESEGVKAFLHDDITIDTDPLVSNAIGGVKLKVLTKDFEVAKTILGSISEYSLDNQGKPIYCPKCNSTKIKFFSHINDFKSLVAFVFGFLFGGLPFYTRYDYTCEACNEKFENQ